MIYVDMLLFVQGSRHPKWFDHVVVFNIFDHYHFFHVSSQGTLEARRDVLFSDEA